MYTKSVTIIVPALFAAALAIPTCASAKPQQITLSGTFSRGQVKKDCDAVGGTFSDSGSYGYGCLANNGNIVNCSNRGKCTGSIPREGKPPHTIGGILRPPSGVKTTGGSAPWKGGHHHPVKVTGFKSPSGVKTLGDGGHAVTITRTEEHHSGGGRR